MMGPIEAIGSVFSRYFQFSGRASRAEFWWFVLADFFLRLIFIAVDAWFMFAGPNPVLSFSDFDPWSLFYVYYSLFVMIPFLAGSCRRLHDAGFSGFWLLLSPVAIVASLVQVVLSFAEGFSILLDFMGEGDLGFQQTVITLRLLAMSVSAICGIVLFVMLVWPPDPNDNIHGAPWRPIGRRPRVMKNGEVKRDPMQAYAVLFEQEREKSTEEIQAREAARKAEVRALYEQRVLGRQPT